MKQAHLQWSVQSLTTAQRFLEIVKAEDIKARKFAKSHQKKKWTKSIAQVTKALALVAETKRIVRKIPKRV